MRKIIPVLAAGAATIVVAGSVLAYSGVQKDVTLAVDGGDSSVRTLKGTVGELLAEEGITVGPHDVVAPSTDSELTDGTRIAVRYGRPLTVLVDGKKQQVWTTATSVDEALGALALDTEGAKLSTSRSAAIGRQGLSLEVATEKSITVKAAGTKKTIETTATTVAQALTAAKITTDADDEISQARTAAVRDGATITVVEVQKSRTSTKQTVAFDVVYKNSDKITKGTSEVDRDGRSGIRTVTYAEVRKDGKLDSRKKVSSTLTRAPVSKIVIVGTKQPKSDYASGGTVWDRLARCESGGNWAINTGNGYSGGLQFSASTWRAYGGSGSAHQNSRAEQIRIAEKIRADVGYSAWPGCSSKLGLR